jgi:CelD/BcsL family acetyltransferase involved in cellulose biosynthesis
VRLCGVAELAHLQREWEDLAQHALEPNPLYEHWMLLPALAGGRDDIVCALAWDGERLDALMPLQRLRRVGGLPLAGYRSWCHRSWLLGTPLVRSQGAADTLGALFDWLAAARTAAIEFAHVPCDGAFHGALADALRERGATVVATHSYTRALLLRDANAQSYIDSALSRESRKNLRRKEKRLGELGELAHVALGPGADAPRWIEAFLQLEASGWKGKLGSALACSAANRRFAEEALRAAFARGRLQMLGIDVAGKPVARCCNLLAGSGSYAYRTAYDESFAYYSPGILAELDTVRAFHAAPGLEWMDSITDPDNATINRLWKHRRTMETLVVGLNPWGEVWVSMLPLMRWAKRRISAPRDPARSLPAPSAGAPAPS